MPLDFDDNYYIIEVSPTRRAKPTNHRRLDDEDGQPIFTFSEEGGTAILDGGDTDVTVHKPLIANSTYTGGGLMTTGGNIVIPDAGNIGSASDTDAIAIASDGKVTFSQEIIAPSLDISGNVDIDGTLETDALSLNGTSMTATASELNLLDGGTSVGSSITIADSCLLYTSPSPRDS